LEEHVAVFSVRGFCLENANWLFEVPLFCPEFNTYWTESAELNSIRNTFTY
jgi:hypothetical protein